TPPCVTESPTSEIQGFARAGGGGVKSVDKSGSGVAVFSPGPLVAVTTGGTVAVGVEVAVLVALGVNVSGGVAVALGVAVAVSVAVGVSVGVTVSVGVPVGVSEGSISTATVGIFCVWL